MVKLEQIQNPSTSVLLPQRTAAGTLRRAIQSCQKNEYNRHGNASIEYYLNMLGDFVFRHFKEEE
jgi:hypothetical protein